jgi:hypothetical protein
MSRTITVSKAVATGVSITATLAGVGLIAHADTTPDAGDASPAPGALPVAAGSDTTTTLTTIGDIAGVTLPDTAVTVTATTVLDTPGAAGLPTKSTDPALAIPLPSFDTVAPAGTDAASTAAPTVAPPGQAGGQSAGQSSGAPPATAAPSATAAPTAPTAPVATAAPPPATPAPEPVTTPAPAPVTTAAPPATLPPLTAPPGDGSSQGTQ